eukprot:TRINITY_DN17307_c0_g1_i2.p1 TRINITY_DN17307_c0_g1~~TRINITY_DN17307_c0_g1_i2.p1  ORF type:complete len:148 (+),score=19.43 TRINITY_DN17307_c0_g1_i2:74-517(+)
MTRCHSSISYCRVSLTQLQILPLFYAYLLAGISSIDFVKRARSSSRTKSKRQAKEEEQGEANGVEQAAKKRGRQQHADKSHGRRENRPKSKENVSIAKYLSLYKLLARAGWLNLQAATKVRQSLQQNQLAAIKSKSESNLTLLPLRA